MLVNDNSLSLIDAREAGASRTAVHSLVAIPRSQALPWGYLPRNAAPHPLTWAWVQIHAPLPPSTTTPHSNEHNLPVSSHTPFEPNVINLSR